MREVDEKLRLSIKSRSWHGSVALCREFLIARNWAYEKRFDYSPHSMGAWYSRAKSTTLKAIRESQIACILLNRGANKDRDIIYSYCTIIVQEEIYTVTYDTGNFRQMDPLSHCFLYLIHVSTDVHSWTRAKQMPWSYKDQFFFSLFRN